MGDIRFDSFDGCACDGASLTTAGLVAAVAAAKTGAV
jgi:hypothetical protein